MCKVTCVHNIKFCILFQTPSSAHIKTLSLLLLILSNGSSQFCPSQSEDLRSFVLCITTDEPLLSLIRIEVRFWHFTVYITYATVLRFFMLLRLFSVAGAGLVLFWHSEPFAISPFCYVLGLFTFSSSLGGMSSLILSILFSSSHSHHPVVTPPHFIPEWCFPAPTRFWGFSVHSIPAHSKHIFRVYLTCLQK